MQTPQHRLVRTGLGLIALAAPAAAMAGPVTFTGVVEHDFDPTVAVVITDPGGQDVGVPQALGDAVSGLDLESAWLQYDDASDTLFVGLRGFGNAADGWSILGDVDGDGDPGHTDPRLTGDAQDHADFGGYETFTLVLDIDQDGIQDVVAGIPGSLRTDLSGYTVARAVDGVAEMLPHWAYGDTLVNHIGAVFGSPSADAPHLEFTIRRFSELPTSSGRDLAIAELDTRVYLGSADAYGIGDDSLRSDASGVCLGGIDLDGDGAFACDDDCDDTDDRRAPGAPEVCDGVDNDCDGVVPAEEATVGGLVGCADDDGDGLDNATEIDDIGTDPENADTDHDGLTDREELEDYDTSPLSWDTDGDGLGDGREVLDEGTDPNRADTDGDGLNDTIEIEVASTDPLDPDTDDGGVNDGDEVYVGTDPLDPSDDFADEGESALEGVKDDYLAGGRAGCTSTPLRTLPSVAILAATLLGVRRRR